VPTYQEYNYRVTHHHGWGIDDLDKMLFEVKWDGDLEEGEREALLQEIYRLIWNLAQSELGIGRKP
jgi:hypothetical protein